MTGDADNHLSLKAKIESWLDAEGIAFDQLPDINSFFHIQANLKNSPIHINESKVRKGVLAIHGVLEPNNDQLFKVGKISEAERKTLFRTIFAILDRSEYLFMLQEDFSSKGWLRIQRTLYVEDLTRTTLLTEMKDLNTKFVNINYALDESLNGIGKISGEENQVYT